MTNRVYVAAPESNHADVAVYTLFADGRPDISQGVVILQPGGQREMWVHSNQKLMIEEMETKQ
jgi:hypothetical protein